MGLRQRRTCMIFSDYIDLYTSKYDIMYISKKSAENQRVNEIKLLNAFEFHRHLQAYFTKQTTVIIELSWLHVNVQWSASFYAFLFLGEKLSPLTFLYSSHLYIYGTCYTVIYMYSQTRFMCVRYIIVSLFYTAIH